MKIESGNRKFSAGKREPVIFLFFTLLTLVIYFQVRYAGFVTDFIGFETNYDKCGFWHYYDCAGIKNFRYLQHAFSFILYKTVGSDSLWWYILYGIAHGAVACLAYRALRLLMDRLEIVASRSIAFFSALIFLVSPYNSEVIVWKVCIQYMTVGICLFLSMIQFMRYLDDRRRIRIFIVILLFLVALFSLEQAVIIPPVLLMLGVLFYLRKRDTLYIRSGLWFSLPLFLLTAGYFGLSKLVYGHWIMHYGSQALDGLFSLTTYSNFYKLFFKHLLLFRYWEDGLKTQIVSWLGSPAVLLALTALSVAILVFLLIRIRKGSIWALMILFCWLGYMISVVPVVSLFFTNDRLIANDRVGYIPSLFVYALLVISVYHIAFRFRYFLIGIFIFLQSWYLAKTIRVWKESQHYLEAFIREFDFYDHKQVVVLSVPHSHHGAWMMLILGGHSGLQEVLQYRGKHAYTGQMLEVSQFNQLTENDALKVITVNDSILNVSFQHTGSWFDRNGVGLYQNDYETEHFAVWANPYGYEIVFRNLDKDHVIIYPDSLRWKSLYLQKFK